jgi:hypothetical protein
MKRLYVDETNTNKLDKQIHIQSPGLKIKRRIFIGSTDKSLIESIINHSIQSIKFNKKYVHFINYRRVIWFPE